MAITRDQLLLRLMGAVTAGGAGGAVAILINTGFKSDDVFAFSGAIVGAVGAVWGAAWVADQTANRVKHEEHAEIVREIEYIGNLALGTMRYFPKSDEFAEGWRPNAEAFYEEAQLAEGFLSEVISHAKTVDFRQRREIKLLAKAIKGYLDWYYDAAIREEEVHPLDERSYRGTLDAVWSQSIVAKSLFGGAVISFFGFGRRRI
ncbi:MAG: hypothetical protein ACTMKV_02795 [Sphingomonas parapaucimobilis]